MPVIKDKMNRNGKNTNSIYKNPRKKTTQKRGKDKWAEHDKDAA